uniref:Glycosyltransferase n=1 Tax=Polygala tenuifolia TaxID=355332 RepID=A0A4P2X604_9FABA|nr:UDP-glycosyltransferase [Polygala tenuifolia]
MEKAELVFIPSPGVGHIMSTVEIAKVLLNHDERLSITVFIINSPFSPNKFNPNIISFPSPSLSKRIKFTTLPDIHPTDDNIANIFTQLIDGQAPNVKKWVNEFVNSNSNLDSPRLAGFVIDMFCTAMIDVANEFGVPTYMFFTSSAAYLAFKLHMLKLRDEHNVDTTEFKNSDAEFIVPSCVNPVPAKVLPEVMLKEEYLHFYIVHARRSKEVKGILVNSFLELESRAVHALQSDDEIPPVYPVGPILQLSGGNKSSYEDIFQWLDNQPPKSVVFLCFGSMGTIVANQVMEFASALEKSGVRFLWSLRKRQKLMGAPSDVTNFEGILPEGFLDRTAGVGKIIGWAPQVEILAHKATGGFVSHCGWNSSLESIYFGVPMATLPLSAEQQFNAFSLVKEYGVAVEIKMDYRVGFEMEAREIVSAEVIEKAIVLLMQHDSDVRRRAKAMKEISRKALVDGGSSVSSLRYFIDDVFKNMPM